MFGVNFKRTTAFLFIFSISFLIGNAQNYPAVFDPNTLNGKNGFIVNGLNAADRIGSELRLVGDINHDGLEDIAINSEMIEPHGHDLEGTTYVIFGSKNVFPSPFDLTTLNGTNGFKVEGIAEDERRGKSIGKLGDIYGDGMDDVSFGTEQDKVIVLYGKSGSFSAVITLNDINGTNGFIIDIDNLNEIKGNGDFNGDGIKDVVMGQYPSSGQTYILFGKNGNFPASITTSWFDGTKGFRLGSIDGNYPAMFTEFAGDVNNDGYDDVIVGFWLMSFVPSQKSYVYFGRPVTYNAVVDLKSVTGADGFAINNYITTGIKFLVWVGALGDINKDGYDDFYSQDNVVYGAATFPALVDLVASPNAVQGFKLPKLYNSAASAGDLNGDGVDDFIITSNNNEDWIVYGSLTGYSTSLDVTALDVTKGFKINNLMQSNIGRTVSGKGDINGDGLSDFMIGNENGGSSGQGVVYVVFGGDHYAKPLTTTYPKVSDISYTTFTLQVNAQEKGKVHYGIYSGTQNAITNTSVILNGTNAIQYGEIQILQAASTVNKSISALTVGTTYDVYLYFEDASGNIGTIYFLNDVTTLTDTESPVITCLTDAKNSCGVLADYVSLIAVSDNADSNPIITQSPAAGSVFNPNMTVTITAEDKSGNKSECSFLILGSQELECPANQSLKKGMVLPDYTKDAVATGFCNAAPTITQTPAPGTRIEDDIITVALNAVDENSASASCSFVVSTVATDVQASNADSAIKIYPNPAQEIIHIEGAVYETYEIIDGTGSVVMRGKEVSELNLGTLKSGMYMILFYNQQTQLVTMQKIIKR